MEWIKYRLSYMNKYYVDAKSMADDYAAHTPSLAEAFKNPQEDYPGSGMSRATHRERIDEDNFHYYYGASKHYAFVDPYTTDVRSIQYAGEYRTYLILKKKDTGEWVFPTKTMLFGQTFLRAKVELFEDFTGDTWKIKIHSPNPILATVKQLTEKEKEGDIFASLLNGVRTFYFYANHADGVPEINDKIFSDFAWIPKPQLSRYFTEEYYNSFIHVLRNK